MKKRDSTNYEAWLEKGQHDLDDAIKLLENDGHNDTICFHCQQAVEKYFKGYLVFKQTNPRGIHHLEEIAKDCAKFDKDFLSFLDESLLLTRYYIETRYPPLVSTEYSLKETRKAIQMAQEIIKFVQRKIK